MKNFLAWVLVLVFLAGATYYLEQQCGIVTAVVNGSMTEEEEAEFVKQLHDELLNREKKVVLQYRGNDADMESFVKDSVNRAFELDDKNTSSDFDYMHYVHSATHVNMRGVYRVYTVEYEFDYLESREQTQEVDRKIAKVIKNKISDTMSDYEKIKIIHDYIIDNVDYDTSIKQNSPYYALVEGRSACQGYATLLYKMATEVGIPCRVITGTAQGGLHAWNIVELDGEWYNIDATWDDPLGAFNASGVRYRYFLKSDSELLDHVRDDEFMTSQFYDEYPMASRSYMK